MYEYFEHRADIGIRGIGKTMKDAFQETAKAMFGVMGKIENVEKKKEIRIECDADDEIGLLIEFLNKLLSEADINDMFFSEFKVKIEKNEKYKLVGNAIGEKRNPKKHELKLEVKAATYSNAKVEKKDGRFIAQCIVDV
jgi:SHS2 domain-containing protein